MKKECEKILLGILLIFFISCEISSSDLNEIRILTYNVQNLFDDVDNGTEYPEFDPGTKAWDSIKYRKKLKNISDAINASGEYSPDIIALQEIENAKVLADLKKLLKDSSSYKYSTVTASSPITSGLLSKFRVEEMHFHKAYVEDADNLRDIIETHFNINNERLVLFINHWKSKSGGAESTEPLRIAYSSIIKRRIRELKAAMKCSIIILGDLNENPDEYVINETKYETALMPFKLYKSENTKYLYISENQKQLSASGVDNCYSPWIENAFKGSYAYNGKWEKIDHFLLYKEFFDEIGLEYSDFQVIQHEFLLDENNFPKKWISSISEGYSDHLPILLILSF